MLLLGQEDCCHTLIAPNLVHLCEVYSRVIFQFVCHLFRFGLLVCRSSMLFRFTASPQRTCSWLQGEYFRQYLCGATRLGRQIAASKVGGIQCSPGSSSSASAAWSVCCLVKPLKTATYRKIATSGFAAAMSPTPTAEGRALGKKYPAPPHHYSFRA